MRAPEPVLLPQHDAAHHQDCVHTVPEPCGIVPFTDGGDSSLFVNHPSGESQPSDDDCRLTKHIVEGAHLLGIPDPRPHHHRRPRIRQRARRGRARATAQRREQPFLRRCGSHIALEGPHLHERSMGLGVAR